MPTSVDKVRVVQTDETNGETLAQAVDRLGAAVAVGDAEEILAALGELVPECVEPLRGGSKVDTMAAGAKALLTSPTVSA